jgi:hypothetical protein
LRIFRFGFEGEIRPKGFPSVTKFFNFFTFTVHFADFYQKDPINCQDAKKYREKSNRQERQSKREKRLNVVSVRDGLRLKPFIGGSGGSGSGANWHNKRHRRHFLCGKCCKS